MRRAAAIAVLTGVLLAMGGPALAVSHPFPEPPHRLTVQGVVKGKLANGAKVRFRLIATDPRGWFDLSTVQVLLLLNDQPIQTITYAVNDAAISSTGQEAVKLGGPSIAGSFLKVVNGTTSRLVRQTFGIRLDLWVRVEHGIPQDALFRFIATNRKGDTSRARRPVDVRTGFLSWGTFGLAAVAALFMGSVIGTARTSRKYRQREPSVWDILERRLKEQRARPPTAALVPGDGGRA
jgi:hypothetical protein